MMKHAITAALLVYSAAAFTTKPSSQRVTSLSETKADLETIGKGLNPVLKYFDPLGLADSSFWGQSDEFTIGFLRHSEIKHGRIAMFAFVGYIVQSNNIVFPWPLTLDGTPFPSGDLSPPEQWDALPLVSKMQILVFIGFLEWYSELAPVQGSDVGQTHYTQGGQPGKYPSFDDVPHPVPFNYFDPFKYSSNMSAEKKEKRLLVEINNGRLAMIGILGFLSEQKVEGSVPVLSGLVKHYDGEPMAPFEADWPLSL